MAKSTFLQELWNDPERRAATIEHMKEAAKKRRKHTDISVSQIDDLRTYQREYQRIYRKAHPEYYRLRSKYAKAKKEGTFTGTFKEWRDKLHEQTISSTSNM